MGILANAFFGMRKEMERENKRKGIEMAFQEEKMFLETIKDQSMYYVINHIRQEKGIDVSKVKINFIFTVEGDDAEFAMGFYNWGTREIYVNVNRLAVDTQIYAERNSMVHELVMSALMIETLVHELTHYAQQELNELETELDHEEYMANYEDIPTEVEARAIATKFLDNNVPVINGIVNRSMDIMIANEAALTKEVM